MNLQNKDGDMPLHEAATRGFDKLAELLIRAGANVNAKNKKLNTPLHLVAKYGNSNSYYHLAELLINSNAEINARNSEAKTPLDLVVNDRSKS